MAAKISITGDKRLLQALKEIPKTAASKGIRKGSRAGNKEIASLVKTLARKKTGKLQKTIKVKALKRKKGRIGTTIIMGSEEVMYAGFQEYGTKYIEASHSMKEAAEKRGRHALDLAMQIISKEILEAWKH